jgi:hypothetical protein
VTRGKYTEGAMYNSRKKQRRMKIEEVQFVFRYSILFAANAILFAANAAMQLGRFACR